MKVAWAEMEEAHKSLKASSLEKIPVSELSTSDNQQAELGRTTVQPPELSKCVGM